jgi:hypothetical protein
MSLRSTDWQIAGGKKKEERRLRPFAIKSDVPKKSQGSLRGQDRLKEVLKRSPVVWWLNIKGAIGGGERKKRPDNVKVTLSLSSFSSS